MSLGLVCHTCTWPVDSIPCPKALKLCTATALSFVAPLSGSVLNVGKYWSPASGATLKAWWGDGAVMMWRPGGHRRRGLPANVARSEEPGGASCLEAPSWLEALTERGFGDEGSP